MVMNPVLKKIHLEDKEFVRSDEVKGYCKDFGLDYYNTIRNLTARGYLLRIFRGLFYVKSFDEVKMGSMKYSHLELVSRGMDLKGISNWYFGLNTALKLNNATHEHFTVDYVVSDTLFRNKPINIAGYKFRFIKLKESLFTFGIKRKKYRYSDLEKTILDLIYMSRYSSVPKEKIVIDIEDYMGNVSKSRIKKYSTRYPKTVRKILGEII
jgi:predicted transcriptional regulator of viral defense system